MEYIATMHLSNTAGIGIIEIEHGINDLVRFQFVGSDIEQLIHESEIYYNPEGVSYFEYNGIQYDLGEFIRHDL